MTRPVIADRTPRRWRARPEALWGITLVVLVPVIMLTALAAWLLITTTHPTHTADQIEPARSFDQPRRGGHHQLHPIQRGHSAV